MFSTVRFTITFFILLVKLRFVAPSVSLFHLKIYDYLEGDGPIKKRL